MGNQRIMMYCFTLALFFAAPARSEKDTGYIGGTLDTQNDTGSKATAYLKQLKADMLDHNKFEAFGGLKHMDDWRFHMPISALQNGKKEEFTATTPKSKFFKEDPEKDAFLAHVKTQVNKGLPFFAKHLVDLQVYTTKIYKSSKGLFWHTHEDFDDNAMLIIFPFTRDGTADNKLCYIDNQDKERFAACKTKLNQCGGHGVDNSIDAKKLTAAGTHKNDKYKEGDVDFEYVYPSGPTHTKSGEEFKVIMKNEETSFGGFHAIFPGTIHGVKPSDGHNTRGIIVIAGFRERSRSLHWTRKRMLLVLIIGVVLVVSMILFIQCYCRKPKPKKRRKKRKRHLSRHEPYEGPENV